MSDNFSIRIQDNKNPQVFNSISEANDNLGQIIDEGKVQVYDPNYQPPIEGGPTVIEYSPIDGQPPGWQDARIYESQSGVVSISAIQVKNNINNDSVFRYTGNSNHIEIVRFSEIPETPEDLSFDPIVNDSTPMSQGTTYYSLPVIDLREPDKFYYRVYMEWEEIVNEGDPVTFHPSKEIANFRITDNYVPDDNELYLRLIPDPRDYRLIFRDIKNNLFAQSNPTQNKRGVSGYVRLTYRIFSYEGVIPQEEAGIPYQTLVSHLYIVPDNVKIYGLVNDSEIDDTNVQIYQYLRCERVDFDYSSKEGLQQYYPVDDVYINCHGSHFKYEIAGIRTTNLSFAYGDKVLILDLNHNINYLEPSFNHLTYFDTQFQAISYITPILDQGGDFTFSQENGPDFTQLDGLNSDFILKNFCNFYTSYPGMGIAGSLDGTPNTIMDFLPLVYSNLVDEQGVPLGADPGILQNNFNKFLYFEFKPDVSLTSLYIFNAIDELQAPYYGYSGFTTINPIYEQGSFGEINFTANSFESNYSGTSLIGNVIEVVPVNINDADSQLNFYLKINSILEGGNQITLSIANDVVYQLQSSDKLTIENIAYTDKWDSIIDIPEINGTIDLLQLIDNSANNLRNLKFRVSFTFQGQVFVNTITPSDIVNFFTIINKEHTPEEDNRGLVYMFNQDNEVFNPHTEISQSFNYSTLTRDSNMYESTSYNTLRMIDINMYINKEVTSQTLVNLQTQNYHIDFIGNNNLTNIPISDSLNSNFSINLDNTIKFRPTVFKIFGRFEYQVDLYVYISRASHQNYTIINAGEITETVSDNNNYIYHYFSLGNSIPLNYFEDVKIYFNFVPKNTSITAGTTLGDINHLILSINGDVTNNPREITTQFTINNNIFVADTNLYQSYLNYYSASETGDLLPSYNRFINFMKNDINVTTNTKTNVEETITINNQTFTSYEYYLGNSQLDVNYTLSETKATLVIYETDTLGVLSNQLTIDGNDIDYSSTTNTIIPPDNVDELGVKIIYNENNLLVGIGIDIFSSLTTIQSLGPLISGGYVNVNNKNSVYESLNSSLTDLITIIDKTFDFGNDYNGDPITYEIFRDGFITDEIFDLDNDLSVEKIKRIVWCKCSNNDNEIIDLGIIIRDMVMSGDILFLPLTDNTKAKIKIGDEFAVFTNSKRGIFIDDNLVRLSTIGAKLGIRFKLIGNGSGLISLSFDPAITGLGGDPYMTTLSNQKYKIPTSNAIYNYIDNNCILKPFSINFETKVLEGNDLSELNKFILNQIMIKNKLRDITELGSWMYKNKVTLDQNACFMKKIYIRNCDDAVIFDLDNFIFTDLDGNKLYKLPLIFKPVYNENFQMCSQIADHIGLNNAKPTKCLRIETLTYSYGKVIIDFMQYNHPQIRNNLNVIFEINPKLTNSIGGVIKRNHYILDSISSRNYKNKLITEKVVNEVYLNNIGKLKINKILE